MDGAVPNNSHLSFLLRVEPRLADSSRKETGGGG